MLVQNGRRKMCHRNTVSPIRIGNANRFRRSSRRQRQSAQRQSRLNDLFHKYFLFRSSCNIFLLGRLSSEPLSDTVKHNRKNHHRDTTFKTDIDSHLSDAGEHLFAQAAGADHPADHDHRKREHDGLIQPSEDRRHRDWQLRLEQQLTGRCPESLDRLNHLLRNLPNPQRRQPHRRWHGKNQRRNRSRHAPEPEEKNRRNQINKSRHRLHEIEQRTDRLIRDSTPRSPNSDRHTDQQREKSRSQNKRERFHRRSPISHRKNQQKSERSKQSQSNTSCEKSDSTEKADHHDWRVKSEFLRIQGGNAVPQLLPFFDRFSRNSQHRGICNRSIEKR